MLRAPHRRFAAWYEWKGFQSQLEAAGVIGCTQVAVSHLLQGRRDAGLKLGLRIQELTADWPEGPIRVEEWSKPEDGSSPEPESPSDTTGVRAAATLERAPIPLTPPGVPAVGPDVDHPLTRRSDPPPPDGPKVTAAVPGDERASNAAVNAVVPELVAAERKASTN